MKRSSILLLTLIVLSMVLAACGGAAKPTQPPAPAAPAAQPTTAPAAAAPAAAQQPAAAGKAMNTGTKYYWLQLLKGHPVHQLTQIGFMTGCKQLGIQCEVVGPDQPDAQQAIAMGEQILAKGDAAGISIWTGSPAYKDLIEKFNAANVPVVAPHFAVPEGTWPKNTVIVGTDPAAYAEEAAKALCTAVGKDTKGSVAVTQGSFNTTEDLVAASFTKKMNEVCPNLKVLKPEEEGFDAPKAVAKAVAIMQANPDLVAALSTTGGGPTTWAGAQKEAGKKIPAIGMDYTRVNLDLVKNGEMYAVVGQPLWDESMKAAELLKKMHDGEKVDYWTKQDAPIITKDQLQKYYDMLDTAESQMAKPAAAAPAAGAKVQVKQNQGTKYYWLQLLKGHPVHQLTQIGFMAGCKEQGIQCEVVGPDQADAQQAIAMGEQILAKGDAAGISIWTGSPAYKDLIEKFNAANVPVVAPHFAVPQGTWPANTAIVGTDPAAYAEEAAKALCTAVGKDTKGSVAVTQGSFNTTEDLVAASFTKKMNEVCPNLKVLKPEEEGFDAPKAVAKAVAIMQANPDLVAALSTTGGGPTTWAGAQKEAGKKIPAIGMDYTRVNLDLVKNGEMYAVVGQPLWDESFKAAELLKKMHAGEAVDYWTKQDAPVITKDQLQKYYDMLDTAEKQMKK